ncbi:hypothetical protein [Bacillus sp. S/N-304-OC-R1]|uniref:hypothetical protein n=1 Tax=Bacillus sp. S/N-304-OC-R1 TaxID=2758034 RepID=UPI001C8E1DEC|nr:hypothetical protein [Bacillus sp. S/N-304-OC-R1]
MLRFFAKHICAPLVLLRKAEAPRSPPTSIRQSGGKVALYLLDRMAYDLEGVGAGARQ